MIWQTISHTASAGTMRRPSQGTGLQFVLEMPPGHVLSDLANGNIPSINSIPVDPAVLPRVLRLAIVEQTIHTRAPQYETTWTR